MLWRRKEGYSSASKRYLEGGFPEMSAGKPAHGPPITVKIKILFLASRSAAPIIDANVSMGYVAALSRPCETMQSSCHIYFISPLLLQGCWFSQL